MVVVNTTIGILFKLPLVFIPILNVYAEYYFKNISLMDLMIANSLQEYIKFSLFLLIFILILILFVYFINF